MNVQGINNYSKQNFTAQLAPTDSVMELTKFEVNEGRFNAYKQALKNLGETHKGQTLNIIASDDGQGYIVKNMTNHNSVKMDYGANLTDVVNEIARPTSEIHKKVFNCDGRSEIRQIYREFYA